MGENDLHQVFVNQLNKHGYGFHYRALEAVRKVFEEKKSDWLFEASEFPSEVQGAGTRIDFILRQRENRTFMLVECKRSDPKFNNWCFVRAPYVRRNRSVEKFLVEHVCIDEQSAFHVSTKCIRYLDKQPACHISLPIKSPNKKGDSGKPREAIEDAASQICRGLNGMVELLAKNERLLQEYAVFIPVIFTTAKLWSSDIDLCSANLDEGKVEITKEKLTKEKWIFYQYHISPGIKHSILSDSKADEFSDFLDDEFIRTIPIVTANAIEEFLATFSVDLDFMK